MLGFTAEIAREAGKVLLDGLDNELNIEHKGAIDLVTNIDLASEKLLRDRIQERFPDHEILGEEGGLEESGSQYRWIIDPLDGTTNYAHHYPFFSISIALEYKGHLIIAAVYDPTRDELFTAEAGKGARLNGKPIQVSVVTDLLHSLLSTGFPYDVRSKGTNLDNWARFARRAQALRRDGSAALNLAYVACGRFDGFWEQELKPWDQAAGSLIVAEAGGMISDFSGNQFSHYRKEIIASNGRIHQEMIEVLGLQAKNMEQGCREA